MSNKVRTMSVKEILSIPALDYFIEPENCRFFLRKQSDYEDVANVVNSAKIDGMMEIMNDSIANAEETPFGLASVFSEGSFNIQERSDNVVSAKMSEKMKEEYIHFSDKISSEKLLLFLAGITQDFLEEIDKVKNGKVSIFNNSNDTELCYGNGDIISINGNKIILSRDGNRKAISKEELQEFEDKMVEAILISNRQINSSNKVSKNSIAGNYKPTGQNSKLKRISFSAQDLQEHANSTNLLKRLSMPKMIELLDKKIISRNTILKMLSKGAIDKNIGIELMLEGQLKQEEILSKVFKVQRMNDIVLDKNLTYESKLLLYSAGKIKVDLLEKSVKEYQEENIDLTESFRKVSKYYSNDIRKISELLTHNVLDYNNSQRFLNILEEEGKITPENRIYLDNVMVDFKTNELLNNSENEVIAVSSGEGRGYEKYKPGLTIDPEERKRYFQSLGAVKKVKIRGENFIKDSEKNVGKKNSLDGYELFIVPEKRVAILEKLYQTTRDASGNIEYKKSKEEKLVPAVENATYAIPIEMALEFSKKKNKKELIESPDVRRISHSMEWVCNLESKVKSLMKTRGIQVDFEQENTEKWADRIRKNYLENKKKRETR